MTSDLSDKEILNLIIEEKMEGLQLLFERYFPIVSKTAFFVLKDPETAKDLSQDLFMKLWLQKEKLKSVQNLKAYLITAIKNTSLNYLEKENRHRIKIKEYFSLSLSDAYDITIKDNSEKKLLEAKIQNIIAGLPPKCRLIFMMSRFEGLTNDEIAEYLEITKSTVERQITTALSALRKGLSKEMISFISIVVLVILFLLAV